MWKAHPLSGVGGGNSRFKIGKFQPTDFEGRDYARSHDGQMLHSVYFTVLSEHGIVGVLVFGFIAWSHFLILLRLRNEVRRTDWLPDSLRRDTEIYVHGLNGAIIGYLTSGVFLSITYYSYFWFFTALAGALDIAVRREMSAASRNPVSDDDHVNRLSRPYHLSS